MNESKQNNSNDIARVSTWQKIGPILVLMVLSPVIGEVMSGATRLSYIFVLIPEIMVWGCGTLLIRELVRVWQGGWTSTLLLGFGLAIAEEFIIQQTSIAPLPWLAGRPEYGRLWGVNWPYFVFMLGYEAVWIVLVPIQVTELLFPMRRAECWLRWCGRVAFAAIFFVGSFLAWFLWTQQARPNAFHVPVFHPPLLTILSGLAAILVLAYVAYLVRRHGCDSRSSTPPHPWIVAATAFLLGLPWYALMALVFGPVRQLSLLVPMFGAAIWALGLFLLVRKWALSVRWQDLHRWALCFGALLVCITGGFLGASGFSKFDLYGKIVLNILGIGLMLLLRFRIAKRSAKSLLE
jgi:hypothetical protein